MASFTYDPDTTAGKVRLLIPDTVEKDANGNAVYAFTDTEIDTFLTLYNSNPFYAAARALETIAVDQAKRLKFIETQGLKIDGSKLLAALTKSVERLRTDGREWEEQSDSEAVFGWAEMVTNTHSYTERIWNEALRS